MRISDIEKRLAQRPFVAFRLCMSDGEGFRDESHVWVRHPELVLVTRSMLAVAVNGRRGSRPDDLVLCDPVHVVRLEPVGERRKSAKAARPAKR